MTLDPNFLVTRGHDLRSLHRGFLLLRPNAQSVRRDTSRMTVSDRNEERPLPSDGRAAACSHCVQLLVGLV
ncbi:hypothetical protein INR49_008432, partial [Caranx melampygus]